MNKLIHILASMSAAVVASVLVTRAAEEMSAAEFFARDKAKDFKSASVYGDLNFTHQNLKKADVMQKVARQAKVEGVPVSFALRVTKVESGFQCNVIGPKTKHGRAQGVMQILPTTAARMGHQGGDLANCEDGLLYGMAYLSLCFKLAGNDENKAAACYVGGEGMASGAKGKYAKKYVNSVKYAKVQTINPVFVYAMN